MQTVYRSDHSTRLRQASVDCHGSTLQFLRKDVIVLCDHASSGNHTDSSVHPHFGNLVHKAVPILRSNTVLILSSNVGIFLFDTERFALPAAASAG